jgi:hypothetical protein
VLALNVEDLDLANRRAKMRRKGGAIDVIVWQTGTARLLPRLLKGRKSGPVFVTERKAWVPLSEVDLDPSGHAQLSYQQAAALFSEASGGHSGARRNKSRILPGAPAIMTAWQAHGPRRTRWRPSQPWRKCPLRSSRA